MRHWHGGAAAFAGSAHCDGPEFSVAQVAGSDVDSGTGLSGGGSCFFAAPGVSVGGAGLLATGCRSGFGSSFAG